MDRKKRSAWARLRSALSKVVFLMLVVVSMLLWFTHTNRKVLHTEKGQLDAELRLAQGEVNRLEQLIRDRDQLLSQKSREVHDAHRESQTTRSLHAKKNQDLVIQVQQLTAQNTELGGKLDAMQGSLREAQEREAAERKKSTALQQDLQACRSNTVNSPPLSSPVFPPVDPQQVMSVPPPLPTINPHQSPPPVGVDQQALANDLEARQQIQQEGQQQHDAANNEQVKQQDQGIPNAVQQQQAADMNQFPVPTPSPPSQQQEGQVARGVYLRGGRPHRLSALEEHLGGQHQGGEVEQE